VRPEKTTCFYASILRFKIAGGDPNRKPSPEPGYGLREATYGSGGMIPSGNGDMAGQLDSVRMTSGNTIVGADSTMGANDMDGRGQMPQSDDSEGLDSSDGKDYARETAVVKKLQ
jgi:hypothetical protein